ncbi:MAG: hypothetical protein QNK37_10180 [Acidobacteriota bacterium]|nr:hypothetical protein [Acidobacteriota bacterium]
MIAFDHRLNRRSESFPPLPFRSWGGIVTKKSTYLVFSGLGAPTYGLTELALEEKEWKVLEKAIRVYRTRDLDIHSNVRYQNGWSFLYPGEADEDVYTVDIHHPKEQAVEAPILKLHADVTQLWDLASNKKPAVYILSVARGEESFYVTLSVTDAKFNGLGFFLDEFAHNGDFKGRKELPNRSLLIWVQGGKEVFLLDKEELILTQLKP